ncbi:MAG: ARMT1-like domain-containing protein [Desulfitobacteriaceae bacterium]|nr:ARMT1-like domain-containing protein [Desulfitobacteriaceae bacterium]MDD4345818.1 ARMT1-like domain-containing protein [Desulfitobacteriaceae bacterium]MDD4400785.1 ARMT1-like domain-containing protein [Desulfitobacteriaceae bacterium]
MHEVPACIPCYLKQAINTFNQVGVEDEKAQQLLRTVLPVINTLDPRRTPAENSTVLLHKLNGLLDNPDPFLRAKQKSNELALRMLPRLRKIVEESTDPLFTACKVAIAGNIIDLGILENFDIDASVEHALGSDFAHNDAQFFKNQVEAAHRILILGDNSGEIVFDRLLAEQLKRMNKEVVYAVKGGTILNDATMEDAETTGMTEAVKVIDNGTNYIGTILEYCSPEFCQVFFNSDVVISKGQGNYETLESIPEAGDKTFFLLRAKCPAVARKLEVKLGDIVFARNVPERDNITK